MSDARCRWPGCQWTMRHESERVATDCLHVHLASRHPSPARITELRGQAAP